MHSTRPQSRPEGTLTLHMRSSDSGIQLRSSKAQVFFFFFNAAQTLVRALKKNPDGETQRENTKCTNCSGSERRVRGGGAD